jgi:hypothetical protein
LQLSALFAQRELKINTVPLAFKTFEPYYEHYFTKRISTEAMASIGFIKPAKVTTANYWYRPRLGFGLNFRAYWTKPENAFQFYNGILSNHNIQRFGTKNQKIERIEHFTGVNMGTKIKLNSHFSVEASIAFAPLATKRFNDVKTNSEIKYVSRFSSSSSSDWDFNLDFGIPEFPENKAFLGNFLICYRF